MLAIWLPKHEISWVFFHLLRLGINASPFTRTNGVKGVSGQPTIVRKGLGVEIHHTIFSDICVILLNQSLNEGNHLRDVFRRTRHSFREFLSVEHHPKTKRFGIVKESVRKIIGNGIGVVFVNLGPIRKST